MIRFQRMSIHNKLALALWGAALLAFVVAGVTLALFGRFTLEGRARQIMEPYAQLVSVGAETAVAFEDPERAREILATLRANPQILGAELVLRDGRLLADYHSGSRAAFHPFKDDGVYLYDNNAELQQRLQDDAHLRLVMNLDELNRHTRNVLLLFSAGVLLLLVAVTLVLRAALQRTIVRPISTLAETVEQVRTRADYHQRVPDSGADEVARLGRSFNAMLGVIQEREDDLRRLTFFQRTILDNAAYGIISTTPEGIVTSFNPAVERLLGYTADEMVGKQTPACWHDPEEVTRHALRLSGELGETITPGFEAFAARARRNLPEENEWTFIRKDGRPIPVNLSVTALRDEEGHITGFVGMGYDLTERKRAEEALRLSSERLQLATRVANIGIWDWDIVNNELVWDDSMYQLYGIRREDFGGAYDAWIRTIHPEDMAHTDGEIQAALRGEHEYSPEFRIVRPAGTIRYLKADSQTFRDEDGKPLRMIGINIDITERKRAEEALHLQAVELEEEVAERQAAQETLQEQAILLEYEIEERSNAQNELEKLNESLEQRVKKRTTELEQANVRLMELDRLKSMFIASMSHELRTPLNSVIGFSRILLNEWLGPLNGEQKENLDTVLRSGKHLLSLVNDVIDVSKIEAGMIEVVHDDFDIYDLVLEAAKSFENDVGDKGVKLTVQAIHHSMHADKKRLLQCLLNLISNAVKYTEKGEVIICAEVSNDGGILEISVTDTGIGINEEDLDKIFSPFVRLDSHLTSTVPGTGLGLYLTRKLLKEVLRGDITVTSVLGVGSRLVLAVPVNVLRRS